MVEDRSLPLEAECLNCAHVWAVAFYPAPLEEVARKAQANGQCCPKCGNGPAGIVVAMNKPARLPDDA